MLVFNQKIEPVSCKLSYLSLVVLLLGSLVGCQPAPISLNAIAEQKSGKVVYLTGKVTHIAPFVDTAAYQLEDNTGNVWVVTRQTPPVLGKTLSLKGRIEYQSLPFAEQELGDFYVVELEQLETQNESSAQSLK